MNFIRNMVFTRQDAENDHCAYRGMYAQRILYYSTQSNILAKRQPSFP